MKRLLLAAAFMMTAMAASAQSILTSDESIAKNMTSWRFSVQSGYGYRVGRVDRSQDQVLVDHAKKLKHGFMFGADATCYFMGTLGVGLKYSALSSSANESVTVTFEDGNVESGQMKDNIRISFIGPMASYRMMCRDGRDTFLMNLGLGYLGYRNDAVLIDPYVIKGGSLGYLYELGYDLGITDKVSIGASFGYISGSLFSYEAYSEGAWRTVSLDSDSYESLTHLQLSIGVRINL